jgi:hypothetical protein
MHILILSVEKGYGIFAFFATMRFCFFNNASLLKNKLQSFIFLALRCNTVLAIVSAESILLRFVFHKTACLFLHAKKKRSCSFF